MAYFLFLNLRYKIIFYQSNHRTSEQQEFKNYISTSISNLQPLVSIHSFYVQ